MDNIRLKFIAEEVSKKHPELAKESVEVLSVAMMMMMLMK